MSVKYSTFVVNRDSALVVLNADWQPVREVPLDYVNFFDAYNSRNWHHGYATVTLNRTGADSILLFDNALQPILRTTSVADRAISEIIYDGDSVMIIAGPSYGFLNRQFYFKGIDLKSSSAVSDIGIAHVSFKTKELLETFLCGLEPFEKWRLESCVVEVKNYGTTPVHEFILSSSISACSEGCALENYFHEYQNGFELLPGESRNFDLGNIELVGLPNDFTSSLCLGVLAPDYHLDVAQANDFYCLDELIATNPVFVTELNFYPNPADDRIWFTEHLTGELSFFDMTGRLYGTTHVNSNTTSIDMLSQGMYLLQFKTASGEMRQGKLLRQ